MTERPRDGDPAESSSSPFRGLRSFSASDADAALFFGRDREQELIVANLLASRLTLLYGQSGIGKSSILCAGVVNALRRAEPNAGDRSPPAVVYVSEWHAAPDVTILGELRQEARRLTGQELEPPDSALAFDRALAWWAQRLGGQLLLILDQFEQYFLYHPSAHSQPFDRSLADAILRPDLGLHCLISLREDSLVGLDRFKGELPNLFRNRLRLGGLSEAAALEVIRRTVDRYNEQRAPGQPSVALEPGLAEAVARELQEVLSPLAGGGGVSHTPGETRAEGPRPIEPAHLQLVMEALWTRDIGAGSTLLRLSTLTAMGGCDEIVGSHVEASLADLPAKQRAVAARAIRYLITPSGIKVAHTSSDLADYAEAPKTLVAEMLARLCDLRIMRPLPPEEGSRERRYEVFHDLLAGPMLEWRAGFEARRLGLRMRWLLAALSAALATAIAIAAYSARPGPLQRLELKSVDARFHVRGTVAADRDIVIVYVDSRTLRALPGAKVGTVALRPYYAKLIDLLVSGRPKVVADDVEFHKAGNDGALLRAIKHADGRIVLVSERFDSEGDVPLFGMTSEGGATELLEELNHAQAGYGGLPRDPDGISRYMRYQAPTASAESPTASVQPKRPLLAFSVAVAKTAEPRSASRFSGQTLIDYHGPPNTFASVSMIDVLRGLVAPGFFKDKIVVIGVSAPGHDLHPTPFNGRATMPGAEVQANAISTVRHGAALRTVGTGITDLAILALSLTAVLVAFAAGWVALGLFAAVAGGFLLLAQLLFDGGLYLPLVYPLLALVIAGVGTALTRLYLASQSRARRPPAPAAASRRSPASAAPRGLERAGAA
jgi:CHASE2 domain-containing sensor protein